MRSAGDLWHYRCFGYCKEGQSAAFVQGMGRQCFDLTVIGAGKAAGRSKGDIPEGETEIPGCQAVDLGGNGRIIRIGSGLGTEDGMFAFRRRQGEYRDSIGGERNAFLAKQQGDITGEDILPLIIIISLIRPVR